jgi:hypothetical protein
MNHPTLENYPSMRMNSRFDSFAMQSPGLKAKQSNNNGDFDFPEIQLYDEPSFMMSQDGEKHSILQDLNL